MRPETVMKCAPVRLCTGESGKRQSRGVCNLSYEAVRRVRSHLHAKRPGKQHFAIALRLYAPTRYHLADCNSSVLLQRA